MEIPIHPIKEEYLKKSKEFSLSSDKMKKYFISFQTECNSEISIAATGESISKIYYKKYPFTVLKKNKYFSLFDTIDEIFDEIINLIAHKNPMLYEEKNCLKIIIETFHSKFKDITFYLDEKKKSVNDSINELYLIINQLKEKEKIQDEKIKKLEEKIDVLEKKNKDLIQKNERLGTNVTYEKESLILKDKYNYEICLKNWINPNKKISFKLLYRMSRDGDSIQTFHKLCDNQGPTVSLYLLDDGNIVGGYISLSWNTSGGWQKDKEAFVFNLNKNLKCVKKTHKSDSVFFSISYSGFYGTLGYYESSYDSMKKLFFFNSDSYFRNGNQILDYNENKELEPKEVEILSISYV